MIKQVYAFQTASPKALQNKVNAFLVETRAPLVHEVQFQVAWDDEGLKYSALVVIEEQEKPPSKR